MHIYAYVNYDTSKLAEELKNEREGKMEKRSRVLLYYVVSI